MQEILRPEYLCVSYTGERDSLMDVQKQVKALKQTLHKEEVSVQHQNMTCVKENEGFTTSGRYSMWLRQVISAKKVMNIQVH